MDRLMNCFYCNHLIDEDTYGWGHDDDGKTWHSECYQFAEGIAIV